MWHKKERKNMFLILKKGQFRPLLCIIGDDKIIKKHLSGYCVRPKFYKNGFRQFSKYGGAFEPYRLLLLFFQRL